ncbi:hypothetical protein GO011_14750 [Mycobacterium sp. 20091114027_K0903767]|nr:hypothetical protein [Mycobacterium sp. 20091114027_K0903767]
MEEDVARGRIAESASARRRNRSGSPTCEFSWRVASTTRSIRCQRSVCGSARFDAWEWTSGKCIRSVLGATIRAINGAQECDGRSPDQVQSRVHQYRRITNLLGIDPGDNLSC